MMDIPTTPNQAISAWLCIPYPVDFFLDPTEFGKGLVILFRSTNDRNHFYFGNNHQWRERAKAIGFASVFLKCPNARDLVALTLI
jgi:hypothetical protein